MAHDKPGIHLVHLTDTPEIAFQAGDSDRGGLDDMLTHRSISSSQAWRLQVFT